MRLWCWHCTSVQAYKILKTLSNIWIILSFTLQQTHIPATATDHTNQHWTERPCFLAGAFPCGWHQPPTSWDRLPMGWAVLRKLHNVKFLIRCPAIQTKETPEALPQQGDAVHLLEQGYLPLESLLRNQQSLLYLIHLDKIPPLFPHLRLMWICLRSLQQRNEQCSANVFLSALESTGTSEIAHDEEDT